MSKMDLGDGEGGQLKGIAKASAALCEVTTWSELGTYYFLYTLGFLAHYYPVSFLLFSYLITRSRIKLFSKSCAILGMLYIVEQRMSQPSEAVCCSDFYYVSTGAQTAKLLPAFLLLLLGSRAFRDKSFTDSLDYAHSGQVAAFFQIFPSYALSLFDLFEQNLTLATFASLVLISAVTFGNYRSVMLLWLRRVFGRYCLVVGSFGLNVAFFYFDWTIKGGARAGGYWAVREAWSVMSSYEVECIYIEKQVVKKLAHGESCLDLLRESNAHLFLRLSPQWGRRRLQTRFFRLIWKYAEKIPRDELLAALQVLQTHGAYASHKTKALMLKTVLQIPTVDLFLIVNYYKPDYFAKPVGFVGLLKHRIKSGGDVLEMDTLRRIEEFVSRRQANIVFLLWTYRRQKLRAVQRMGIALFRDMTFYIA